MPSHKQIHSHRATLPAKMLIIWPVSVSPRVQNWCCVPGDTASTAAVRELKVRCNCKWKCLLPFCLRPPWCCSLLPGNWIIPPTDRGCSCMATFPSLASFLSTMGRNLMVVCLRWLSAKSEFYCMMNSTSAFNFTFLLTVFLFQSCRF